METEQFNNLFYIFAFLPTLGIFLGSALSILYYSYLWQLKEYRLDRFVDNLRIKDGYKKLLPPLWGTKVLKVLIFLYFSFFGGGFNEGVLALSIISIVAVFELMMIVYKVFERKVKRPKVTSRSILNLLVSLFLFLVFSFFIGGGVVKIDDLFSWLVGMLFADLGSIFVVSAGVFLVNPVSNFIKNLKVRSAKKKMQRFRNIKVVGITGSYGKSSVKEFLFQILEKKYKVLKTPGNVNTEIGVAEVVLKSLKDEHEIFVCEMGAYKMYEIKKICDVVMPDISIVTAVSNQHLGLFGSVQNLEKAKFEIVENCKEGGVAIFNEEEKGAMKLFNWAKEKRKDLELVSVMAEKFLVNGAHLEFEFKGRFSTKLCGIQNIPNLVMAIECARKLGVEENLIVGAVKEIKGPPRTMELVMETSEKVVIDDSYNTGPAAAAAAINYMALFNGFKKILVFPGMMELGEISKVEHEKIGKLIAEKCDRLILTSEDFIDEIREGMGEEMFKLKVRVLKFGDREKLKEVVDEECLGQKSVVIFESRY